MRLSDAIRLGSALGPQTFGNMFDGGGACAMGAAALAIDSDVRGHAWVAIASLRTAWPDLDARTIECPSSSTCVFGDDYSAYLFGYSGVMAHLNDFHKWTREQIADWVEQIENELTPTTADALPPNP